MYCSRMIAVREYCWSWSPHLLPTPLFSFSCGLPKHGRGMLFNCVHHMRTQKGNRFHITSNEFTGYIYCQSILKFKKQNKMTSIYSEHLSQCYMAWTDLNCCTMYSQLYLGILLSDLYQSSVRDPGVMLVIEIISNEVQSLMIFKTAGIFLHVLRGMPQISTLRAIRWYGLCKQFSVFSCQQVQ